MEWLCDLSEATVPCGQTALAWALGLFRAPQGGLPLDQCSLGLASLGIGASFQHVKIAAEGLEPAEVNPAQLRKTAFILVGIIVIGAIAVTASYIATAKAQQKDPRPAFVNELKGHIRFQLSDGSIVDTSQIEEDVWLYYQTSIENPDAHVERDKALALLPDEGVKQVEFYVDVDPNSEEDRVRFAALEQEPGVWKVAAKAKVLEKYLKSKLRFGTIPHKKDGELVYDSSVALIKRDQPEGKNPRTHVRGEMFDFERAAQDAERAQDPALLEGYRTDWFLWHVNYLLNEGDPTSKQ